MRASIASEPAERSEPAKRRAREAVGGSGGAKPPGRKMSPHASEHRERASRTERAGEAASERGCRGVRRGEAPRKKDVAACERASRASQPNGASRRSGERERL